MKLSAFIKNESILDVREAAGKAADEAGLKGVERFRFMQEFEHAHVGEAMDEFRKTNPEAAFVLDNALRGGLAVAGGLAAAPVLGALGAGGGAGGAASAGAAKGAEAGTLAANVAGGLSARTLAFAATGGGIITSFFAAMAGIPQNVIGKAFNKWASDNDIDVGNLRLASQIALYTTPVADPVTGKIEFLDNDGARLLKRMQEAGVPISTAKLEMIRHNQERTSNEAFIRQFETGQIGEPGKSLQEQALAGEKPIETLARLQKEKISSTKAAEQKSIQTEEQAFAEKKQRALAGIPADVRTDVARRQFGQLPESEIRRIAAGTIQNVRPEDAAAAQSFLDAKSRSDEQRIIAERQDIESKRLDEERAQAAAPPPVEEPPPTLKNMKAQAEAGVLPGADVPLVKVPDLPGTAPIAGGVNKALDEIERRRMLMERAAKARIRGEV